MTNGAAIRGDICRVATLTSVNSAAAAAAAAATAAARRRSQPETKLEPREFSHQLTANGVNS